MLYNIFFVSSNTICKNLSNNGWVVLFPVWAGYSVD